MIYRYMYAAYRKDGEEYRDAGDPSISTVTLAAFSGILFLYYESAEPNVAPERAVAGVPAALPDGKTWIPMPDIFHYSKPLDDAHWVRRVKGKRPWVRLNRVKTDKVGSYIFWHHQLQEEQPGLCDKYGIIGLFGEYLFMYLELPEEPETVKYHGDLNTHNTPDLDTEWAPMMSSHFKKWEDCPEEWRDIDVVFTRGLK